jgi:transcriptional regulator with XRE-family HTH domain
MTGNEWNRLGDRIVRRRTELQMRTTVALAARTGLTPRMLGDIEKGRRQNYSPATKARIEAALDWEPGSIAAVLAGLEPTAIRSPPANDDDGPDYTIDHEASVLESGWSAATELAAAVLNLRAPSEEVLAAARRAIYVISGYLIIRILEGPYARQLEGWLARIYSERERVWRQLSTGAPEFPGEAPAPRSSLGGGRAGDEVQDRSGSLGPWVGAPPTDHPRVLRDKEGNERDHGRGG